MRIDPDKTIWDYFTQINEVTYTCNKCKEELHYKNVLVLIYHVCKIEL